MFVLFLTQNKTIFQNKQSSGLVYNGNEKISDLVNRDTDGDGVPDWQEGLYGTDPTKKDTDGDGIPDNIAIARMNGQNIQGGELNLNSYGSTESLNQTEQLSRELFSTLATLNQAGGVDQDTIEKLSSSFIENLQNTGNKKIFIYSDIKISKNDSAQAIKNYDDTLNKIYKKYPMEYTVIDVLNNFVIDENNVDESVLVRLSPIIQQINGIVSETSKMEVPPSLAILHLNVLNKLQRVTENISDIRLYEKDVILAMAGISQYEANANQLEIAVNNLAIAISQRLK